MTERIIQLFDKGECITKEIMIAFLEGTLSSLEQHHVEKHLLECEFCSDALDGFQLVKDRNNIGLIVDELNDKINNSEEEELDQEEKIKVLFPWQMAAAFALLILSGLGLWFFIPKHDSTQLFTQEFKPYKAIETNIEANTTLSKPSTKEEITDVNNISAINKISNSTSPILADSNTNDETKRSKKIAISDEIKAEKVNTISLAAPAPAIPTNAISVAEEKVKISSSNSSAKREMNTEEISSAKENISSYSYKSGMEAYQQGNYELAISILGKITDHQDALFYSGVANLSIGNPEISIKKLEDFRKAGKHELAEASLWYEALANLKLNDKKSAEKCLQQVLLFNGNYKVKAEQLLQKI